MVRFKSTRGDESGVSYEDAVLGGYAADGGLYVPERMPSVPPATLESWSSLSFQELAVEVLLLFAGECISATELRDIVDRSFDKFTAGDVVPVVNIDGYHVAELFHGPTLAFKDFGQQVLCKVLDFFAMRAGRSSTLVVSTTGDTGPAAIHGCLGSSSLSIVVTYPKGQISDIQRRQMTTVNVPNVAVSAFEGSGDDMDRPIKRMTTDRAFKEAHGVTSVNSINIGRITVQVVHYFWAYLRSIDRIEGATIGQPLHFAIPTGAMGNVTAGVFAQRMGCPIAAFGCGVNANNILHRAVAHGTFHQRPMVRTLSEAINIGVPYNFERVLYFLTEGDTAAVSAMMAEVDAPPAAALTLPAPILAKLRNTVHAATIEDETMLETIRSYWRDHSYLLDPHSAVCLAAASVLGLPKNSTCSARKGFSVGTVCLSTAHPCKFEEALASAFEATDDFWAGALRPGKLAGTTHMPASAAALAGMPEVGWPDFVEDPPGAELEEVQVGWEARLREMVIEIGQQ
uniref:Threonine synthase N-terminal domain-containing protein n=1 Tax=Odontella aurita TaxID=265563 RepID=A0A7S4HJ21_9STRA|mmetsp:Transcript_10755/g.31838  ORF Transcript_10755/g.31838 Transcript_10755/m.31838 type:complete len:513 (+) Transcript_10755:27-1565(+)